ncbi:MAG: HPr family phosphocarrier protein [Candidatus Pristimantibacillus lignocellulolyticus]|uniref:HPr family phosphocarrier protein n=1 Tax=Candidatus Pristimantibacillus lignocellulolyticus TaxID=2994561 RepID=A0A9J6ZFB2_9BACL|nr:MAG: HPr family phosphocarrier protein [Candidatus Pristimantibacillus lignocellulolyticus]
MISQTFTIINPTGFHVRPTKTFVQLASSFPCKITLHCNGKKANGKSSLSMLTLGLTTNSEVLLETDGDQEQEALKALGEVLTSLHD